MIVTKTRGTLLIFIRPHGLTTTRHLSSNKETTSNGSNENVKEKENTIKDIDPDPKKSLSEDKIKEVQTYDQWLSASLKHTKKDVGSLLDKARPILDEYKENILSKFFNYKKDHPEQVEWYTEKVNFVLKRWEKFTGLTAVKAAQALVVKEEKLFIEAQEQRRDAQLASNAVQTKLKNIRSELERTPRGADKYLELITQEHAIIKQENELVTTLQNVERKEREKFKLLSLAVRDSHEKERTQAESAKYHSIIAGFMGAFISGIFSMWRMRELRLIVQNTTQSQGNVSTSGLVSGSVITNENLKEHQEKIENLSSSSLNNFQSLDNKMNEIQNSLKEQANRKLIIEAPPSKEPNYEHINENLNRKIEKGFQNLKNEMMKTHSNQMQKLIESNSNQLSNLTKMINTRDVTSVETLKQAISNSYNTFSPRMCDIEEKVKDVRSLLLTQVQVISEQPKISIIEPEIPKAPVLDNNNNNANNALKINQEVIERSNKTIMGSVELRLQEHEDRINNQIVVTGLMVAVLAPIVSYVIKQLF